MENNTVVKKINPKTFVFVKYLLTAAFVLFYTTPVLAFLDTYDKLHMSKNTLLKLQVVLIVLAVICFATYFFLKFFLHSKTGYQYNKTEKNYLLVFTLLSVLIAIFSIMVTFLEIAYHNEKINQIMFYVFEPLIIILGVSASFIEQRARFNEQVKIYNDWYEDLSDEDKEKEDEVKTKTNKNKSIIEKEISNKKNPFMDEKGEEVD